MRLWNVYYYFRTYNFFPFLSTSHLLLMLKITLKAIRMEFADSLRNELFKPNASEIFKTANVTGLVEAFSRLISYMEAILLAYNKLETSSFELKTVLENFIFAENVIDKNTWSRPLKPGFEQRDYTSTELSIKQVSRKDFIFSLICLYCLKVILGQTRFWATETDGRKSTQRIDGYFKVYNQSCRTNSLFKILIELLEIFKMFQFKYSLNI